MKKKHGSSIGSKLTAVIILMALALGAATILAGYYMYRQTLLALYEQEGAHVAATAGQFVDWDRVGGYLETGETDEDYQDTLDDLRTIADNNDVAYLFVLKPSPEGTVYVYDTDSTEAHVELGELIPWYDEFLPVKDDMLAGKAFSPIVSDEEFGWLLSIYLPQYDSQGRFAGYVGVDISMDEIRASEFGYLRTLVLVTGGISLVIALISLYVIRRMVVRPINRIAKAADEYLIQTPGDAAPQGNSIERLDIQTHDELGSLAESLKSMESKLRQYVYNLGIATVRAETDSLSGLMNREAFRQRVTAFMNTEPDKEKMHAFVMIDIDRFKAVNDTLGHVRGDEVLQACANILRDQVRSSDFVARIGGDEFAVFYKDAGSAEMMAQKAAAMVEEAHRISLDDAGLTVTLSIGVALYPVDGTDYDTLYHSADEALYQAKNAGRDQFSFCV